MMKNQKGGSIVLTSASGTYEFYSSAVSSHLHLHGVLEYQASAVAPCLLSSLLL